MAIDTNQQLALELSQAEKEIEVISILKRYGYWDNPKYWRTFGDMENNWSTIGNQMSKADSALVEKIVNSVDALLIKESLKHHIDPESAGAPSSISAALEKFYEIPEGKISNLSPEKRESLAKEHIILAATGLKTKPNLTIVDQGEGQSPKSMPETILSINKSNKLKVPFVQGKFNMGGTGVLSFCGKNNFQLIISKKAPEIAQNQSLQDDLSKDLWGITIVRRERPTSKNEQRSSKFTYLTDEKGNILTFDAGSLDIIPMPSNTGEPEYKPMFSGMYCKLFDYQLKQNQKKNITTVLSDRLNLLLEGLAFPVEVYECRNYKGEPREKTLSGLSVWLEDEIEKEQRNQREAEIEEGNINIKEQEREGENKSEDKIDHDNNNQKQAAKETENKTSRKDHQYPSSLIEASFPISFKIEDQQVDARFYLFKDEDENGHKITAKDLGIDEGVLVSQNGQSHAMLNRRFYSDGDVALSYLKESLLTILDASQIDEATREELFMNSRDRLRDSRFTRALKESLKTVLKENPTLRQFEKERRDKALADKLEDEKPLEEVLSSILEASPALSTLFSSGNRLKNKKPGGKPLAPMKLPKEFQGLAHPTYFIIKPDKKNKAGRKAIDNLSSISSLNTESAQSQQDQAGLFQNLESQERPDQPENLREQRQVYQVQTVQIPPNYSEQSDQIDQSDQPEQSRQPGNPEHPDQSDPYNKAREPENPGAQEQNTPSTPSPARPAQFDQEEALIDSLLEEFAQSIHAQSQNHTQKEKTISLQQESATPNQPELEQDQYSTKTQRKTETANERASEIESENERDNTTERDLKIANESRLSAQNKAALQSRNKNDQNHSDSVRIESEITRELEPKKSLKVLFLSDADNTFFTREIDRGKYMLTCNGNLVLNYSFSYQNGLGELRVKLPEEAEPGQDYLYVFTVIDPAKKTSFINEINVKVIPKKEKKPGKDKGKDNPDSNLPFSLSGIDLPKIAEVHKDEWEIYDLNEFSTMKPAVSTDSVDFYINMDNRYLLEELKRFKEDPIKQEITKRRYKYSLVLIGMSILQKQKELLESQKEENGENVEQELNMEELPSADLEEMVRDTGDMLGPILLPMFDVLGEQLRIADEGMEES